MNIAVNTRLLIKDKLEGIGWFTYESLKRITRQHPEHTFYFIFDRPFHPDFIFSENVKPVVLSPQARHPLLYYIWFEYRLPRLLKKLNADLFVSPDGYLSLKTDTRSLTVIHDLNFEHYPKDLPCLTRMYYRHFFPEFAHKAVRIATVSKFSREDIVNQYHIDPDRIDVVYDGANESYSPPDATQINAFRKNTTAGCPYFLFVGSLHPRKNLTNLFRAFDLFKNVGQSDVKLLIVGAKKWWTPEIKNAYESMAHKEAVIFAGRMGSENLRIALGASLALTYISYFEGFGIPIVEAFRCGTPVITSNVTSMPEVAGDAALLVDPFSPESIAGAMTEIYRNGELRKELIRKGKAREDEFTWQKTADLLWESIEKAIRTN